MCLFGRVIRNPKYMPNKKNGGNIPPIKDSRITGVPIGCGNCIECRKQKAREWNVRLQEDIKTNTNAKMITLTFSNESYTKLAQKTRQKANGEAWKLQHLHQSSQENTKLLQKQRAKTYGYGLDNDVATYAVRKWLERYRKENKKSIRHWLITELGHNGTENIHLHGIIWTDKSLDEIEKSWQYGFIYKGKTRNGKYENYVNAKTVNYMVKYITKMDLEHQAYKPIILTSAGIGKNYTQTHNSRLNTYQEGKTQETYKCQTGVKIALPKYYRNKIYSEEERENLWLEKLDRMERWVLGTRVDISKNEEEYYRILLEAQRINQQLGYGNNKKNWERAKYEIERRIIKQKERMQNTIWTNKERNADS